MSKLPEQERIRFDARQIACDCDACPLKDRYPVQAVLNRKAKLIVLGEGPGAEEEDRGRPFVGRSGQLLTRTCEDFGVDRETDLHITNATLCRPVRKLSPQEWKQTLICCRSRLKAELDTVGCKYVVAMGAKALQTLTGKATIFPWLGSPLKGAPLAVKSARSKKEYHIGLLEDFSQYTLIPCLHPAYCLRGNASYIPVMQTHFGRAWALATGKMKEWQWGDIEIWPGSRMVAILYNFLHNKKQIAVDVETQGIDPWNAPIMCIGLSDGEKTVSIPWRPYVSKRFGDVKGIASYPECEKIQQYVIDILKTCSLSFQNGMYDITALSAHGLECRHWDFDTLPAHAIVAPRLQHKLDFIACLEFPVPMWKTMFGAESDQKGGDKFVEKPEESLRTYNAQDAECTARLASPLLRRINTDVHNGSALFERCFNLMRGPCLRMTNRGVQVSPDRFDGHRGNFTEKRQEAIEEFKKIASHVGLESISPDSLKDIRKLFVDKLGVKPVKYTEQGAPSFDEEALQSLVVHTDELVRQLANAMLRIRRWKKLNDYLDMPLDHENVLHVFWKPYGTRTGRWSSSPNLQNIPKPRKETLPDGSKVTVAPGLRDVFVAREGYWLIEADYKQLELRIAALLARDEPLLKSFAAGEDVHERVACSIFGREYGKVPKDERDITKLYHYAAIYGADVINIWKRLAISFPTLSLSLVERIHSKWFMDHHRVAAWQASQLQFARDNWYIECPISGRRQYYLDGKIEVNEILNFPVQGTGADIVDPALMKLDRIIDWDDHNILMQCHDAIVGETRDPIKFAEMLKKCMEAEVTINGKKCVFPVDVKVGKDWGNMKDLDSLQENEHDRCS